MLRHFRHRRLLSERKDPGVWKEALDGIVTIGGRSALQVLEEARAFLSMESSPSVKLEWVDEAIGQLQETKGVG